MVGKIVNVMIDYILMFLGAFLFLFGTNIFVVIVGFCAMIYGGIMVGYDLTRERDET